MKKGILTLMAMCLALSASAVDLPKQGFGIQIGWAQPILRLNDANTAYPKDSMVNTVRLKGFKIGLVYDASYIAGLGSSMGINYTFGAHTEKWHNVDPRQQAIYPRQRELFTYHEVELFVDWQYKFEVAKETYLMLYTGPTIQCGLGFNLRVDQQAIDNTTLNVETLNGVRKYSAYTTEDRPNDSLKRLNVTWGVGAGFQYKRYFLRGGYDFGLINPHRYGQFVNAAGETIDRNTRGRFDQWSIKIGMYLIYAD